MITYLLRRIPLMLITMLGISLVTLILIHLAPGDPVAMQVGGLQAGKGGLSPEEIEAMRRTYFLHLPVILPNTSPEDARVVNADLIEDLTSSDAALRDRSVRRVKNRGAFFLEDAMAAYASASPESQEAILLGLKQMAPRMGLEADLKAAPDAAKFWSDFLAANQSLYEEGNIVAAVDRFVAGEVGAEGDILKLDTLAMAHLNTRLKDVPRAGDEAKRILEQFSVLTGADFSIRADDGEKEIKRSYDSWRSWWYKNRANFIEFSGAQKIAAVFTETQYAKWLVRIFTLDFDRSSRDNLLIRDKLFVKLGPTLQLAILSLFFSYLFAIPLGVYSAVKQYTVSDQFISLLLFILYSLPSFWVAMLLQRYLCDGQGLIHFPLTGLGSENAAELGLAAYWIDKIWHLILPVTCLTYASLASLSRYQRVGMLDTIRADFIRTARAKGLTEKVVIFKHAMRNSVIPIVTLMGLQLPFLVSGAVIIEMIFQIPGMGLETLEAIRTRDLNWIMASVTLTAVMTMVGILLSDIVYALIDPRIQVGSKSS